jgi:hypothetical protein
MPHIARLAFVLSLACSACVPRSFNQSEKSQLNEASQDFARWFSDLPSGPVANYELISRVGLGRIRPIAR